MLPKLNLPLLTARIVFLILISCLAGCSLPAQVTPPISDIQTEPPISQPPESFSPNPDASPQAFPTKEQSLPATPVVKGADSFPGWASYTNANYDFAFRYPDVWGYLEGPNHVMMSRGDVELWITFRGEAENLPLPADLPYRGEQSPRAPLQFYNILVQQEIVIVDGKILAALYTSEQGAELHAGGLAFTMRLYSLDFDNPLTPDLLDEVNQIMTSFEAWTNN